MDQVLDMLLEEQRARMDAAKWDADLAAAQTRMSGGEAADDPPPQHAEPGSHRAALQGMSTEALSLLKPVLLTARGVIALFPVLQAVRGDPGLRPVLFAA